jgi:predicted RNase H-like HicB family nuclease
MAAEWVGYTVLFHEAAEGGWWAESPDLPGCYSQGETLPETALHFDEAACAWLEVAGRREEDGHS